MSFNSKLFRLSVFSAVLVLMSFSASYAQDSEFSFTVSNKTNVTIKQLLVSSDGKKYGFFDIGAGILPGKSAELVWSKSTDSDPCMQWVKAVYSDKSQSAPIKFDFCEEELDLEFTE